MGLSNSLVNMGYINNEDKKKTKIKYPYKKRYVNLDKGDKKQNNQKI